MSESILVSNYGIHRTPDNIAYLHQGGGKTYNFIGLSAKSPFEVRPEKPRACPHRINGSSPMPDIEHWTVFLELFKDPLVQAFLPLPRHSRDGVTFISDVDEMLLLLLSKMSSPLHPIVESFSTYKKLNFKLDMGLTNVAPLVLTGLKPSDQNEMESMCAVARRSCRKLILSGDRQMVMREPLHEIETNLQHYDDRILYSLPMENLGAVAMRRWARGEQIDSPWERIST